MRNEVNAIDRAPLRATLCLVTVLVALVMGLFASPAFGSGPKTADLVPSPACLEGWSMVEPAKIYTDENLYVYINGEAELYLPYGFKVLVSAVYQKAQDGNQAIVADVYEMGSPLHALGIYSRYRAGESDIVKIGTEGFSTDAGVLFFKDRYFVRVSASGTVPPDILAACAGQVSKKLPGGLLFPRELRLMEFSGIAPRSVVYTPRSVLGYPFFGKGFTGDVKVGNETGRAFIVIYASGSEARKGLEGYRRYLEEKGVTAKVRDSSDGIAGVEAMDPLYKGMVVSRQGVYLVGIGKLASPETGRSFLESWSLFTQSR